MEQASKEPSVKPKTRTGCLTCRARKVKCDETRPTCLRCRNAFRQCEGYDLQVSFYDSGDAGPSNLPDEQEQAVPLPASTAAQELDPETPDQVRSLLQQAADQLETYFAPDVWNEIVLPVAHAEPAVRAALAAVTILYREQNTPNPTAAPAAAAAAAAAGLPTPSEAAANPRASAQYFRAIHLLQQRIDNREPTAVVLLTCIFFICYEVLTGNKDGAVSHLRAGLNIKLSNGNSGPSSAGQDNMKNQELVESLYRLTGEGAETRDIRPLLASGACMEFLRPWS